MSSEQQKYSLDMSMEALKVKIVNAHRIIEDSNIDEETFHKFDKIIMSTLVMVSEMQEEITYN